jgi:hypothetical protein
MVLHISKLGSNPVELAGILELPGSNTRLKTEQIATKVQKSARKVPK